MGKMSMYIFCCRPLKLLHSNKCVPAFFICHNSYNLLCWVKSKSFSTVLLHLVVLVILSPFDFHGSHSLLAIFMLYTFLTLVCFHLLNIFISVLKESIRPHHIILFLLFRYINDRVIRANEKMYVSTTYGLSYGKLFYRRLILAHPSARSWQMCQQKFCCEVVIMSSI